MDSINFVKDDFLTILEERKKYLVIKRCMDIFLSLFALIVLFPSLVLVAIIIRLDSKGSIIFKQYRTGMNGRPFLMYKFRSMTENAEAYREGLKFQNIMDGPVFKVKNDPRVTRFGKFLRSTSIDELPQLINILRGEMSIVGPRPLVIYETEKFSDYENKRHIIKPGLTCYWQIQGRSNIYFNEWIELDHKYIKEMSIKNDLIIIFKTIIVVIKRKGAY